MEQLLVDNKYNLQEEDISCISKRAKVLILNSKKEILLGYSNHTYQFIGGHMEGNESYSTTIQREILEETGIQMHEEIEPFFCRMGYYKDYPEKGINQKKYIYYGVYHTDQLPNMELTNYTEEEEEKNFVLRYVPLELFESVLKENCKQYQESTWITNEMLFLWEHFSSYIQ